MFSLTVHKAIKLIKERYFIYLLTWAKAESLTRESIFIRRNPTGKLGAKIFYILKIIALTLIFIIKLLAIAPILLFKLFAFPLYLFRRFKPSRYEKNRYPIKNNPQIMGNKGFAYSGDAAQVYSLGKAIYFVFILGMFSFFFIIASYFLAAYWLLSGTPNIENQKFLINLHQYRTAIAVRDKQGHLLGVMPNDVDAPADYFDYDSIDKKYRRGSDRESALYVDHVPEFFWKVLVEREHKTLSFNDEDGFAGYIKGVINRSYRGIDVAAPIIKKLSMLKGESGTGGGSSLLNIMIKNLYGADNFFLQKNNLEKACPYLSWNATICRKFIEYRAARDLFPYLSQNKGEEFKRWVSTHAGLVGRVGNGATYGIQGAAAVMFGKKPEKLNLAEQSLLAAAYKRDIRFAHPAFDDLEKIELRNKRWLNRKKVAHTIAIRIINKEGKNYLLKDLEQQFEDLKTPKAPKIPEVLKPFFISDAHDPDKQIKHYANLHTRLNRFMSSSKILLENDLQRIKRTQPDKNPVELIVTLPLQEDFEFRRRIDNTLEKISEKNNFNKSVIFSGKNKGKKSEYASIRISVAKDNGEIVRYYLREGSHAVEEKHRMERKPTRPIASIAKLPIATLLIYKGMNPETPLCNQYYLGLSNAGGDTGSTDCKKRFTFKESISKSKNLPLRYALDEKSKVSQEELLKLFEDFSLEVDGSSQSRKEMIENLSFGRARATAQHTHRIINNISSVIYSNQRSMKPLRSIRSVKFVKKLDIQEDVKDEQHAETTKNSLRNIKKYLKNEKSVKDMQELLSSPIKIPGGTLYFANKLDNGELLLGKTGTFDTANGNIKDKYTIGVLSIKGELYTFSILVGSEDYGDKSGLINQIKTESLMKPILQEIINSLYKQH